MTSGVKICGPAKKSCVLKAIRNKKIFEILIIIVIYKYSNIYIPILKISFKYNCYFQLHAKLTKNSCFIPTIISFLPTSK